jgi:hypothetical protein
MSNASIDLDKSTQIMISFPTDLISFFDPPKEGPRKEMMRRAKKQVLKNSLMKTVL